MSYSVSIKLYGRAESLADIHAAIEQIANTRPDVQIESAKVTKTPDTEGFLGALFGDSYKSGTIKFRRTMPDGALPERVETPVEQAARENNITLTPAPADPPKKRGRPPKGTTAAAPDTKPTPAATGVRYFHDAAHKYVYFVPAMNEPPSVPGAVEISAALHDALKARYEQEFNEAQAEEARRTVIAGDDNPEAGADPAEGEPPAALDPDEHPPATTEPPKEISVEEVRAAGHAAVEAGHRADVLACLKSHDCKSLSTVPPEKRAVVLAELQKLVGVTA